LARACGLSKSRASVLAEVLHGTGLLEKRADPGDQRVVRLYVTPRAEDAGRPRLFRDALSTLVADLDAAERTQLLAGLRKLRAGAERRGW
jgi:DNA-binding MarR family transcriptional regulator